jgi:hypothetical protein
MFKSLNCELLQQKLIHFVTKILHLKPFIWVLVNPSNRAPRDVSLSFIHSTNTY